MIGVFELGKVWSVLLVLLVWLGGCVGFSEGSRIGIPFTGHGGGVVAGMTNRGVESVIPSHWRYWK